jgi:DNA-binding Xre family transcriptional regulator
MATAALVPTRFRLQELLDAQDPPLSQRELARRSGVTLVTINLIANNRTKRVDLATLDAIAETLEVHPGELLEKEHKRPRGSRR